MKNRPRFILSNVVRPRRTMSSRRSIVIATATCAAAIVTVSVVIIVIIVIIAMVTVTATAVILLLIFRAAIRRMVIVASAMVLQHHSPKATHTHKQHIHTYSSPYPPSNPSPAQPATLTLSNLGGGGGCLKSGSSCGHTSTLLHFSSKTFQCCFSCGVQSGFSTIQTHKAPAKNPPSQHFNKSDPEYPRIRHRTPKRHSPSWSHNWRHLSVIGAPCDFHNASFGSDRNCSVISVSILAPFESRARSISLTCRRGWSDAYSNRNPYRYNRLKILRVKYSAKNIYPLMARTFFPDPPP